MNQSHCKLVNRPFHFQECSQYFIGTNDETLSVAVRVQNPDRSALHQKPAMTCQVVAFCNNQNLFSATTCFIAWMRQRLNALIRLVSPRSRQ
ncbi:MAG: hypothetical protein ACJ74Y_16195 [Bryobacteraceae bacterium]